MRSFTGTVVARYYQDVTIEVEDDEKPTPDDISRMLQESFNLGKASGEMEVYDVQEVE